eukprot:jgi/Bigna1/133081/aug1.20_g7789
MEEQGYSSVAWALFFMTGIAPWILVNALFLQLAAFTDGPNSFAVPEGNAIASHMAVAIQAGNIVTIVYVVANRYFVFDLRKGLYSGGFWDECVCDPRLGGLRIRSSLASSACEEDNDEFFVSKNKQKQKLKSSSPEQSVLSGNHANGIEVVAVVEKEEEEEEEEEEEGWCTLVINGCFHHE